MTKKDQRKRFTRHWATIAWSKLLEACGDDKALAQEALIRYIEEHVVRVEHDQLREMEEMESERLRIMAAKMVTSNPRHFADYLEVVKEIVTVFKQQEES
jgi:hypothetical protein